MSDERNQLGGAAGPRPDVPARVDRPCGEARELMLDFGWSAADRARVAALLDHLEACEACRAAARDFDRLRAALGGPRSAGQGPEPAVTTAMPAWLTSDAAEPPACAARPRAWFHRTGSPSTLAATLTLAVGTGAFLLGRRAASPAVVPANRNANVHEVAGADPEGPVAGSDTLPPGEVRSRAAAFEQVSRAFDGRADWLLVSDAASDVGLDPDPTPSAAAGSPQELLVIRLAVARRRGTAGPPVAAGDVVSSADVAIVRGRSASLSLPFPGGRTLDYRLVTDAAGATATRVGLWAEVRPRVGGAPREALAAVSTSLDLRPGGGGSLGSFKTGSGPYEITVDFSQAELTSAGADPPAAGRSVRP